MIGGAQARPSYSGRWLLAGAVGVLLAGALAADHGRSMHGAARGALAAAEDAQRQARERQARAEQNRTLLAAAGQLQQSADAAALTPRSWGERQINVRQQHLSRQEANQALNGAARHAGQVLKLDEFELSVTQAEEGLFDMPRNPRQPVLLTLRGLTYFRLAER